MSVIGDAIKEQVDMIPFYTKKIEILSRLQGWLADNPVWIELEPLISSLAIWGDSLSIGLTPEGFKDRSVVRFALVFGKLEKTQSYDGRSINLTAKLAGDGFDGMGVPLPHPTGLESVIINYMPENCRLVETREEISPERRKQIGRRTHQRSDRLQN